MNIGGYEGPALRAWDDGSMFADLRDLNGDGIIDRVTTVLEINFGRGPWAGPWPTSFWGHSIPNNAAVVQTDLSNPGGNVQTQNAALHDIDGDGMLDLVGYDSRTGYKYRKFSGVAFGNFQALTVNNSDCEPGRPPCLFAGLAVTTIKRAPDPYERCESTIMLRQALIDFDGDGRVELVRGSFDSETDGGSLTWDAATVGDDTQPAHLLKTVQSGSATDEITYGYPDQETTKSSVRNWVVKSLVQTDTATDEERSQTITTKDPVYDHIKREFRGHKKVQVSEGGGARYQTYSYLTGEFDFGRESQQLTHEGPNSEPIRTIDTTWEDVTFSEAGGARKWVRPRLVTTTIMDPQGTSQTEVEYTYKTGELERSLGLLESIKRKGEVGGVTGDDRITTYDYYIRDNSGGAPTSSNILLVKTRSEITSTPGPFGQDAATTYYYDGMCPSHQGSLGPGALCETQVWRGLSEPPAVTLTSYDAHGRLESRTDPDNITTTYAYHDQGTSLTPYLFTVTNALAHVVYHSSYHPFSGKAQLVCGPQKLGSSDKCDGFSFDLYGRLTQVRRGLESQGAFVEFVTESYDYDDQSGPHSPASVRHVKVADPVFLNYFSPPQESTTYFNRWGQVVMEQRNRPFDYAVKAFKYNTLGQLETGWLPYTTSSGVYQTPPADGDRYVYTHDRLDRPTSSRHYSGTQPSDPGIVITYKGTATEVKDERLQVTTYDHNGFGEVASISRQAGGQTLESSFQYDSMGRLVHASAASPGTATASSPPSSTSGPTSGLTPSTSATAMTRTASAGAPSGGATTRSTSTTFSISRTASSPSTSPSREGGSRSAPRLPIECTSTTT